jgi:hypothetical protein
LIAFLFCKRVIAEALNEAQQIHRFNTICLLGSLMSMLLALNFGVGGEE